MTIVDIVRVGLVIEGILIILGIFWLHTIKRMAVDLAVVWEFLGGLLFLAGLSLHCLPGLDICRLK